MKVVAVILVTTGLLSGCAVVDKVKDVWPRSHDPALVSGFVDIDIMLDKVNCADKTTLLDARKAAEWLNRYAQFRNDPQRISTKAIVDNLDKASDGNEAACQRWVNLSKTRMNVIKNSWSGR